MTGELGLLLLGRGRIPVRRPLGRAVGEPCRWGHHAREDRSHGQTSSINPPLPTCPKFSHRTNISLSLSLSLSCFIHRPVINQLSFYPLVLFVLASHFFPLLLVNTLIWLSVYLEVDCCQFLLCILWLMF